MWPPRPLHTRPSPLALGVLAGLLLCGLWSQACTANLHGHIRAEGGPSGTWVFEPRDCASGARYCFYGVALYDGQEEHARLRVAQDAFGAVVVQVRRPGSKDVITVPRDRCAVFEAQVQSQSSSINRVRNVMGRLRLDCSLEDGVRLVGDVTFENCH